MSSALRDMADIWSAGLRTLLTGRFTRWSWIVTTLWVVGILGDATTTIVMMRSGLTEEGNSLAASGMTVLGIEGYVLLASVVCVLLAIPTLNQLPTRLYARAAWITLLLIGVGKIYIALSNLALGVSLT